MLGLVLLLAVADGVLAWYWLSVEGYALSSLFGSGNYGFGIILTVIFVLMAVVQMRRGDIYNGPQGYTMHRLSVSPKAVILLQILYHALCWIILWGVQVMVFFLICKLHYRYGANTGDPLANQQIFLLFYMNPLLHSLLPMEETLAWIANLVMIASLSVTSAYGAFFPQEKKLSGDLLASCWSVILLFRRELDSFILNILIIGAFLTLIAVECYRLFFRKKGGADDA